MMTPITTMDGFLWITAGQMVNLRLVIADVLMEKQESFMEASAGDMSFVKNGNNLIFTKI